MVMDCNLEYVVRMLRDFYMSLPSPPQAVDNHALRPFTTSAQLLLT